MITHTTTACEVGGLGTCLHSPNLILWEPVSHISATLLLEYFYPQGPSVLISNIDCVSEYLQYYTYCNGLLSTYITIIEDPVGARILAPK